MARPDSGSSPSSAREEETPDRWGPPVGGREEGAPIWAGRGRRAGGRGSLGRFGLRERKVGRRRSLGRGGKRKKERRRWAGPKGIEKEREVFFFSHFFNKKFKQFNSNLNSREFKPELNNKQ